MDVNIFNDDRFKNVSSDPKFRNVSKAYRKVKIDKRFQSMFSDKKFQLKYTVDKRGRPVQQTQAENFKKYYELSSEDETDESDSEKSIKRKVKTKTKEIVKGNVFAVTPVDSDKRDSKHEASDNEINDEEFKKRLINDTKRFGSDDSESEDNTDAIHKSKINENIKARLQDLSFDYARGVGVLFSDSSSDESSSEGSDSEFIEHPWGELDKDAEKTDEVTRRFAVCHMDWDRICATDLMVLFHSFLPADGVIESVTIYPSEFGLERMKDEELNGPKELRELQNDENSSEGSEDDENSEGNKYHMEKLREYQLKRLKYYYAVIVCNTAETANKLYTECDNMEYESSATKLDLRFISDDVTFDQEPRESCTEMPDVIKYKPRLFANTALQQGKVDLTWDETDPNRVDFTKKIIAGDEVGEDSIKAYIATSSEEEFEEETKVENEDMSDDDVESSVCGENARIAKYRSLLSSIKEKSKKEKGDVEMEITWGVGLKEKAQQIVNERQKPELSHFEKIVERKKAKSKEKKMKGKESTKVDDDNLFSDDDLPSDVDLNDSYFKDEITKSQSKKKDKTPELTEKDEEKLDKQKAELELLLADDNDAEQNKKHFNLKSIIEQEQGQKKKKKWRKQLKKKIESKNEEDTFKIDVGDERFSALYESHLFNIDPADPHFRKTKGMEELVVEKQKRKNNIGDEQVYGSKKIKTEQANTELTKLVESVKRKTKRP